MAVAEGSHRIGLERAPENDDFSFRYKYQPLQTAAQSVLAEKKKPKKKCLTAKFRLVPIVAEWDSPAQLRLTGPVLKLIPSLLLPVGLSVGRSVRELFQLEFSAVSRLGASVTRSSSSC